MRIARRRAFLALSAGFLLLAAGCTTSPSPALADQDLGDPMALIPGIDRQPFFSQTRRLVEALDFSGSPLSDEDRRALDAAMRLEDAEAAVAGALAEAGISANVVAAYHHDHIFVPAADAERALATLRALSARSRGRP